MEVAADRGLDGAAGAARNRQCIDWIVGSRSERG